MTDLALAALTKTWAVTTIALVLLFATLGVGQIWSTPVCLHALPSALSQP
jgi:hypothetical protein